MVGRPEFDAQAIEQEAKGICVIVLGAGLSQRFGAADKLGADLNGKPLSHHILSTLSTFDFAQRILVCTDHKSWQNAYQKAGFELVRNRAPEDGLSASLRLASQSVCDPTKVLICLADMPLIDRAHIARLLEASASGLTFPIATRSADYLGPPAILPLSLLRSLPEKGAGGARALLSGGSFVETELASTHDVDLLADLLLAAELMSVRR